MSARPTTAFDRDQIQHHQQRLQQQQPHEIEEDYEERDDEDVFAFLPPSTADQERQSASFAFANTQNLLSIHGVVSIPSNTCCCYFFYRP
jgi:hypothetical protein